MIKNTQMSETCCMHLVIVCKNSATYSSLTTCFRICLSNEQLENQLFVLQMNFGIHTPKK